MKPSIATHYPHWRWLLPAALAVACVLVWTWWLVLWLGRPGHALAPPTVNQRLLTVDDVRSVVHRPTVDRTPFVASSIKGVYHRADCRYATMMEHKREYASHAEAAADGKVPCKVCLPVIEVVMKTSEPE